MKPDRKPVYVSPVHAEIVWNPRPLNRILLHGKSIRQIERERREREKR